MDMANNSMMATMQADNWTVWLPNVDEGYKFTTDICNGVSDIQQTAVTNVCPLWTFQT